MPVTPPTSSFEEIVLTQAAIRITQMLRDWYKKKEKAGKEPDEQKRQQALSALDVDKGNSRAEVAEHLYQSFLTDHGSLLTYSSRYNKQRDDRVFHVEQLSEEQKGRLKKIFVDFTDRTYDEHGQRKLHTVEEAAASLHQLYETLKEANRSGSVPLRYMRFPASYMLTQLGLSEKWKGLNNGKGIDFTRSEPPKDGDDLGERFKKAFDGGAEEHRFADFKSSPYIDHYQSYVEIEGARFPCLQFGWGRTHLVTDNGYMVDLTKELAASLGEQLKKGIRAENCMIDFTPPQETAGEPMTLHLSSLIDTNFKPAVSSPKQEEWAAKARGSLTKLQKKLSKLKTAEQIDGRTVSAGKAQLVSMDVDLLTGLSLKDKVTPDGTVIDKSSEVARLSAFIAKHEVRPKLPGDLAGMSDFLSLFPKPKHAADYQQSIDAAFNKLEAYAVAEHNDDILALLRAAKPHVKALAPRVMRAVDKHFVDNEGAPMKTAAELNAIDTKHDNAVFAMTVGGIAAGKSNAESIMDNELGKGKYVIAGLDHVRSMFDRQAINLATDNHNYDYKNMEQAGKLVRALVLERARNQGYHVLLDGSGVPYEGRYSSILKAFKECDHQYKTSVLAFDRTLYVNNPALRNELMRGDSHPKKAPKDALLQQGIRTGRELRAVPVQIIATNYSSVPDAILQASQDKNVDRFWLIDTNPKKLPDETKDRDNANDIVPYILSFTTEITEKQLEHIDRLKGIPLREAIADMQFAQGDTRKNKKIRDVLNHEQYQPMHTDGNKWDFKVVNKMDDGRYRIEVITDTDRYLSTLEKGLFNREANGPEELFKLTKLMSFDVEGLFQHDKCMLKTRPDSHVSVEEWPQIPHATPHSLAARREPCLRMADDHRFKPIPTRAQTGVAAA